MTLPADTTVGRERLETRFAAEDQPIRNRTDLRRAAALLDEAGWRVQDGRLVDARGAPFVLDVLLRKHKAIRKSLGVSVPVPVDTNQVVEAILAPSSTMEGSKPRIGCRPQFLEV